MTQRSAVASLPHGSTYQPAVPGLTVGLPHRESNAELDARTLDGSGGWPGEFDRMVATWLRLRGLVSDWRTEASEVPIEVAPLPDESETETRWNERLASHLLGDRVRVMEGDGWRPGVRALLYHAATNVTHGSWTAAAAWRDARGFWIDGGGIDIVPIEGSAIDRYWPRRVSTVSHSHGPLAGVTYYTAAGGVASVRADRLVHITHEGGPGEHRGRALLRSVVPYFQRWELAFVEWALSDQSRRGVMILEEPPRVEGDAGGDANRRLDLIGMDWERGRRRFRIPHGAKASVHYPSGTPPNYPESLRALDSDLAVAWADQMRALGVSGHGSRAAAETMKQDRAEHVARRCELVAEKAWLRIAETVAGWTHYKGRIRRATVARDMTRDPAIVLADMVTAGAAGLVEFTPADRRWARETLGAPALEEALRSVRDRDVDEIGRAGAVEAGDAGGAPEAEARAELQEPAATPAPAAPAAEVVPLNGAQVTSALDVLDRVRRGELASVAAVDALEAVGYPRDKALRSVEAQAAVPPVAPVEVREQALETGQPAAPASAVDAATDRATAGLSAPTAEELEGRPVLLALCGPPCAGKTTLSRRYTDAGRPCLTLSADALLYGDRQSFEWSARRSAAAHDTLRARLRAACASGVDLIVLDAPLTSAAVRARYADIALAAGYDTIALRLSAPLPELLERNARRPDDRRMSESAIRAIVDNFQPITEAEGWTRVEHVEPDEFGARFDVTPLQTHGPECDCGGCPGDAPELALAATYEITGRDGRKIDHYRAPLVVDVRGESVAVDTFGAWATDKENDRALLALLDDEIDAALGDWRAETLAEIEAAGTLAPLDAAEMAFARTLEALLRELLDVSDNAARERNQAEAEAQSSSRVRGGILRERLERLLGTKSVRQREAAARTARRIAARAAGEIADHWAITGGVGDFRGRDAKRLAREARPLVNATIAGASSESIPEPPRPGMVISALVRVSTKIAGRVCSVCASEDGETFLLPEQVEELAQYRDLPDPQCTSTRQGTQPSMCECRWIVVWGWPEDDLPPDPGTVQPDADREIIVP